MKSIARRFFLLAPVWTFPFIDEIDLSMIERKAQYLGILDFDYQRFQTEYMTFHYLYIIGLWAISPSMAILGFFKIREEIEKSK